MPPLVDEARVDLADELAEPLGYVQQLLGLQVLGNVADEALVGVGEISQEEALGTGQAVVGDVLAKGHPPFVELPRHRLRLDVEVSGPGMDHPVGVEQVVSPVAERFGVLELVERLDPLLVLDAGRLHRRHGLCLHAVQLGRHHRAGVDEGRLDDAHDVEGPGRRRAVEAGDRFEDERAERAVEGEVRLQVAGDADQAALVVGDGEAFQRPRRDERAVDGDGLADEAALHGPGFVVVGHELRERRAAVARAVEHVEQGGVVDPELGDERFGRGGHELVEDGLVPCDETLRRLGPDELARPAGIPRHLLRRLLVVDHVLWRLHDDEAGRVVAGAARPPGDLVQLPGAQQPRDRPVVLGEA